MLRVGINARQLADKANVGRSFVYDVLSGKSANPTTKKISAVADVLGVSVPYLIGGISNDNDILQYSQGGFVAVPELYSYGSDIKGASICIDTSKENHFFLKEWVERSLMSNPEHLRILTIQDDGMEPSFKKDDTVLLDIKKNVPTPPGIFAIHDGNSLLIRRLEFSNITQDGPIRVLSDNPLYSAFEVSQDEINIVGKVLWFSRIV